MLGLVALALMIALTFMYFNDLGLTKILAFWGVYVATWLLPLASVPSGVAGLCGLGVAVAYLVAAKSA